MLDKFEWIKSKEDALIYVGDAMCSWCHGFSPELDKIIDNHPELELKLVMGGLRPFNDEKAIDMADFLKSHWVEIEERTGQPFSFDILSDPTFIYDTEPASRAVIVARMMDSELEYAFFKAVQMAFYRDNKNTNNSDTYTTIAKEFDLNADDYLRIFNSEEAKENCKADFALSAQMGVKGFPSLILKKAGEFVQISNGYKEAELIEKTILEV